MKAQRIRVTLSAEFYVDERGLPLDEHHGEAHDATVTAMQEWVDKVFGCNSMTDFDTSDFKVEEVAE
jgi:hypothetical protein